MSRRSYRAEMSNLWSGLQFKITVEPPRLGSTSITRIGPEEKKFFIKNILLCNTKSLFYHFIYLLIPCIIYGIIYISITIFKKVHIYILSENCLVLQKKYLKAKAILHHHIR
jgi:hypothetical protein